MAPGGSARSPGARPRPPVPPASTRRRRARWNSIKDSATTHDLYSCNFPDYTSAPVWPGACIFKPGGRTQNGPHAAGHMPCSTGLQAGRPTLEGALMRHREPPCPCVFLYRRHRAGHVASLGRHRAQAAEGGAPGAAAAGRRRARHGRDHAQGGDAFAAAPDRPARDHGSHHRLARLHDLRHADRRGRGQRAATADAGKMGRVRGRQDLYADIARRPGLA